MKLSLPPRCLPCTRTRITPSSLTMTRHQGRVHTNQPHYLALIYHWFSLIFAFLQFAAPESSKPLSFVLSLLFKSVLFLSKWYKSLQTQLFLREFSLLSMKSPCTAQNFYCQINVCAFSSVNLSAVGLFHRPSWRT